MAIGPPQLVPQPFPAAPHPFFLPTPVIERAGQRSGEAATNLGTASTVLAGILLAFTNIPAHQLRDPAVPVSFRSNAVDVAMGLMAGTETVRNICLHQKFFGPPKHCPHAAVDPAGARSTPKRRSGCSR